MTASRNSYVNLKYLGEFNKYTMALGAAAFLFFDKFETGYAILRTIGEIVSTISVIIGIVIMSILGRIKGDDIDYEQEQDQEKIFLFTVVSRALTVQLIILVFAIILAGVLSLARIWK